MSKIDFNSLNEGDNIPELEKEPVTQVQLIRYAGASGDFNQIHTVPQYAKEAGLDGTIIHGMLMMGMIGQMISNWAGVKDVKNYSVSFKAMSKPGDKLTAKGLVKRKTESDEGKFIDLKVHIEDENGEVKVTGKAKIKCE